MLHLALLPAKFIASYIRQRFTVRIHSRIIETGRSWVRLWYLLRALDILGSGHIKISVGDICQFLAAAKSTAYQWLREGKEAGAFRRYKIQRGILRTHLGGLSFLSKKLKFHSENGTGIAPWGITAEVPLHQILSLVELRAAATLATAQRLQELSRFAAWKSLPANTRKTYKLPQPDAFFCEADQLSDNTPPGSMPCLLHISRRRIFVSKGFVPYGTTQESIARERNLSDRTVRRHLDGQERRQIIQAKSVYSLVRQALDYTLDFESDDGTKVNFPDSLKFGEGILTERPGAVGKEYYSRIRAGRVFRYADKDWIYRCNLYKPVFALKTMQYRKREFKIALAEQEEREKRRKDAELATKLESARASAPSIDLTEVLPQYARTKSEPEVGIINGQVITLFTGERTTNSARRGETTLCKTIENSFGNSGTTPASAGEKDGHFS